MANQKDLENSEVSSEPNASQVSNSMIVTENKYSPEDKSENILSSGLTNIRLSHQPIGDQNETHGSSTTGLVISSKPSHKNNNLSKKEIFSLQPKQANSLI